LRQLISTAGTLARARSERAGNPDRRNGPDIGHRIGREHTMLIDRRPIQLLLIDIQERRGRGDTKEFKDLIKVIK
jgi:hypothetical protein